MTEMGSRTVAFMAAAAGEEQWVHLLPVGEFQGRDGRGPYSIPDRKAAEAVIAATLRHHGEADIVVDYDHQTDHAARPGVGGVAPAAGWITDLDARADGLWGRVEWTETAALKLKAREYRYLSPVFRFDPKTSAISKILRAGLTNSPNLHLTAVASADMSKPDQLTELRSILGLSETAELDAVVEAVRTLTTSANSADPARFAPIETLERVTAELNRINSAGLSVEAAEIAVNNAVESGKVPPALRDWGIALCQQDRAAFDGFVTRTAGAFAHLTDEAHSARRAHRQTETQPAMGLAAEIAKNLGLSADDMKA